MLITFLLIGSCMQSLGQKPKNGVYTYDVAFAEWGGKSLGATVLIKIKGDSIYVIHNGGNLSGKKGDLLDSGIIMKHRKTGKWIIGHHPKDKDLEDLNECADRPSVIDFKNKKYWSC